MKRISQTGEWWIMDGNAIFADNTIGDMGHEAYVLEHVRKEVAEEMGWYGDIDNSWDSIKENVIEGLVSRGKINTKELVKKYGKDFLQKIPYSPEIFDEIAKNNFDISQKQLDMADGSGDVRAYGMSVLGWKRMTGSHIETQTLTEKDLSDICRGIDQAYSDEITDESEFNIEIRGNRKWLTGIPFGVMNLGVTNVLQYRNAYAKNWYEMYKISIKEETYSVFGLIASCMKDYKNKMKTYNLEVEEKFNNDPWVASLRTIKGNELTKKEVLDLATLPRSPPQ